MYIEAVPEQPCDCPGVPFIVIGVNGIHAEREFALQLCQIELIQTWAITDNKATLTAMIISKILQFPTMRADPYSSTLNLV